MIERRDIPMSWTRPQFIYLFVHSSIAVWKLLFMSEREAEQWIDALK